MGARPSQYKKGGGGFLNGVDGVIAGYQMTDDPPFEQKKAFKGLHGILSVRVDGADEDTTTTLFVGSADEWNISKDGFSLTPKNEGQEIGANTGWGKFTQSLVDAKFPEERFPEEDFNWEAMIGTRCRFVQRKNENMNGKKRKDKKTGKEYDYTDLVVDQVYELPGKGGKSAGKTSGKEDTKGKKGKAADDDDEEDVAALASKFLVKVVSANKGKFAKSKVSMALLKAENGLSKHPQREEIRKLLNSDKFLNTEDGWSYDEDKEIITVTVKGKDEEDDE